MKNICLVFVLCLGLLSCQKEDVAIDSSTYDWEALEDAPLRFSEVPSAIGEWSLIWGEFCLSDSLVHLYATLNSSSGHWVHDHIGHSYPLPGCADFEFGFLDNRFCVRSPFLFHHEDFSIWDEACGLADLEDLDIYPEHNYWVLEAEVVGEFATCILESEDCFSFRFSFFQP